MRVLLFGSNGMLGKAIKEKLGSESGFELLCVARSQADFCIDFVDDNAVKESFVKAEPEVVINAGAMVNMQKCEDNPLLAYLINGRFCSILAEFCRSCGSYLVQVSTDHYYAGDGAVRHREDEQVLLLNEYARTKFVGECLARAYSHSVVLRTNIVGFRGTKERPTFLEWAVDAIGAGAQITAFTDYFTSSLHVYQFASILTDILKKRPEGIYNLASSEVLSKEEFLKRLSLKLFRKKLLVSVGSVQDMSGVKRADSLGLDTSRLEKVLGYSLPTADEVMDSIATEYERRQNK